MIKYFLKTFGSRDVHIHETSGDALVCPSCLGMPVEKVAKSGKIRITEKTSSVMRAFDQIRYNMSALNSWILIGKVYKL